MLWRLFSLNFCLAKNTCTYVQALLWSKSIRFNLLELYQTRPIPCTRNPGIDKLLQMRKLSWLSFLSPATHRRASSVDHGDATATGRAGLGVLQMLVSCTANTFLMCMSTHFQDGSCQVFIVVRKYEHIRGGEGV